MLVSNPEEILDTAVAALATVPDWREVLDELPAPIYTTDTEGAVTYWNRACVEFAGRERPIRAAFDFFLRGDAQPEPVNAGFVNERREIEFDEPPA